MSCFYKHELSACCSAPVTSVNCRHCNLKWEKTWQKRTLNTREAACFSFVLIVVFLILWHRTGGNTSEFIPVNGSAVNSIGAKGDRTQRKLKKNKTTLCRWNRTFSCNGNTQLSCNSAPGGNGPQQLSKHSSTRRVGVKFSHKLHKAIMMSVGMWGWGRDINEELPSGLRVLRNEKSHFLNA